MEEDLFAPGETTRRYVARSTAEAAIERTIMRQAREEARRHGVSVEEACDAALRGGEHGVLVVRALSGVKSAVVDPSVPFGWIHEVVSEG